MTAKMKSVWAFGQIAVTGDARPEPFTEHVAVAQGQQGLHGLVAGVAGVFERMKERRQPPPAVGGGHGENDGGRPASPSRTPSGLNGIPAVIIMATPMQASTMAVPMSGWAMTSSTSSTRTAMTGPHLISPVPRCPPGDRGRRRRTRSSASLASSAGCICRDDVPNHLDAPEALAPRSPGPALQQEADGERTWRPGPAVAIGPGRYERRRGTPRLPIVNHISCRSKKYQGEPNCCRLTIEDADSTITTPIRHRMATRATSTQKRPDPDGWRDEAVLGAGSLAGAQQCLAGRQPDWMAKRHAVRWSALAFSSAKSAGHDRGEVVTSGGIGRVPVEAGAARGQHDGVAGVGQSVRPLPRPHPCCWPMVTGARPEKAAPTSPAASPMATTARTGGTVARRAARSSPLLRPPAISTTDEKPATAASTDAGVVALESSYQATPSPEPTRLTRCGRGGVLANAVSAARRGRAGCRGHGRRRQGIGQVVG